METSRVSPRSKRAASISTSTSDTVSPVKSGTVNVKFCTVSMVWKTGAWLSWRSSPTAWTIRSNGTSWSPSAVSAVRHVLVTSSAKPGSPVRSTRTGSVLTRQPNNCFSASSSRLATGTPITTSDWRACRDSTLA